MCILDLGCGTGSNLRALADHLPDDQQWTLIDHDIELLHAAKAAIARWADCTSSADLTPLELQRHGKHLSVHFLSEDLALNIEQVLTHPSHLVTAAAFFDLVSPDWLVRFCAHLNCPFYTVLTYNGQEQWQPACENDVALLAAFHHHQQHDKGFGVAAGPDATDMLVEQLERRRVVTQTASTPWVMRQPDDQALIEALARGSAQAVRETGQVQERQIQAWLHRSLNATECLIGHWDLWARPVV